MTIIKKQASIARLITAAVLVSAAMTACKKETQSTLSTAEQEQAANLSTESETEAEVVFNDVFDNVVGVNSEVGIGGTGIFGRTAAFSNGRDMDVDSVPFCTKVSVTFLAAPARFPVRIALDFGSGCVGRDGHLRAGKIITEYTGRLMQPGNSATTVFQDFTFDSISVEGTHTIKNTSVAGGNQRQFTIDVADAKLSKPNGDYSEWTSQRVITQIEGNGTPMIPADDIFSIIGSGHGRVQHGIVLYAWKSDIMEPLIKKFACHWISKGSIEMMRDTQRGSDQWKAVLDYGQGECDHVASLTINGATRQIQLPH